MTVEVKWNKATLFQKTRKILNKLGDIAGDEYLKRDLAEFTRSMLYKRIKAGKGVSSDRTPMILTNMVTLKPLSKQYKRYRATGFVTFMAKKYYGRLYEKVEVNFNVGVPALGEFGKASKSNLTFSGQMLSSMTFNIRKYGFTVYIPNTLRRGSKITNAQLAQYVSQNGRPFMNLTAGESRIVKSRMRTQIQKRLRKLR